MVNRTVLLASASILLIAMSGNALVAGNYEFELDPVHSAVLFKVKNGDTTYIYGRFTQVAGMITLDDRKEPKTIGIKAEVPSKKVNTNDKARDKHLKKSDFLDIRKHKTISFESKESKKTEDGKYEITGGLTLLGQTHPITVVLDMTGLKKGGPGKYIFGGETTFTIKRSEWGMTKMLDSIADEVTLIVSLQATYYRPPAG